uniref:Battenin n=1 Tax=Acrobeloides nanus TaxID=290746 RepID=A0A914CCK9_9BILA
MLSAAKDILEVENKKNHTDVDIKCSDDISHIECSPISTGAVLLADILPTLFIKLIAPFALQSIPYGTRHFLVLFFQTSSFIIVALSENVTIGIIGVVFASLGAGLGEITYLSLSSNFHRDVISSWSSGTGGSGIFGALIYAILTDTALLSLTPRTALLSMLIIPTIFGITYWKILQSPSSVHKVILWQPSTYFTASNPGEQLSIQRSISPIDDLQEPLIEENNEEDSDDEDSDDWRRIRRKLTLREKLILMKPLFKYMIPLSLVYFGEYFINQGLVELLVFDCKHGLHLNRLSQYRWYQVIYQLGVFISRSSSKVFPIKAKLLPLLAILQMINAAIFFEDALKRFIPHIVLIFAVILYEGLLGGAAYVNTFNAVHKSIPLKDREFSMSFVSLADSFGIVAAGFLAIPVHNFICTNR